MSKTVCLAKTCLWLGNLAQLYNCRKTSGGIDWLKKKNAKTSSLNDNLHCNTFSSDNNAVTNVVHRSCDIPSINSINMSMDGHVPLM